MSRLMIAGAAALATVLPLAPALAQPDGYYDSGSSITVTAPHSRQVGRSATGAPVYLREASMAVNYSDLDLRTPAGRDTLYMRVDDAARDACDALDDAYPAFDDEIVEPRNCRADAMNRARWQVRDAIDRASYYGY